MTKKRVTRGAGRVKGNDECPLCGGKWNDEKHRKNAKEAKCPNGNSCGKKNRCAGKNMGDSQALGRAILRFSNTRQDYHPLFYKNGSIEAHHLICSGAMEDDDDWRKICQITGYNINCYKNGIFLPKTLEMACKLRIPLHNSKHTGGFGGADSYPQAVKNEIGDILKEFKKPEICDDPEDLKELVEALIEVSVDIFDRVKKFIWTITWDGFDYQRMNPVGCGSKTSIREKNGTLKNKSEYTDTEKNEHALSGKIREISRGQALARAKTVDTIESLRQNQQDIVNQLSNDEKSIQANIVCRCKRRHKDLKKNFKGDKIKKTYNLKISK